jgi:phosphoribosyl 1,2-cyclic phosphodiesterase
VRIRFWGTRGSVPAARRETSRYGGNTSCVEVRPTDGSLIVLDAGTGINVLGAALPPAASRVDILLTHLHMDHILGLGFFSALFEPDLEVHIWGPGSTVLPLRARLTRYLSPPLFPVRLRDLPCRLELHDVPIGSFELPGVRATSALVCHPGPTVGYRLEDDDGVLVYLSDHEPALGVRSFPDEPRWTSGFDLAAGADVLVHDAQFTDDEYREHVGWGHSSISHALTFAELVDARHLVGFHHDPWHDDDTLDAYYAALDGNPMPITPAQEGMAMTVARDLDE